MRSKIVEVIVNGHNILVRVPDDRTMGYVRNMALETSGNTGRPFDDWEIRSSELCRAVDPTELALYHDVVYVNLKGGGCFVKRDCGPACDAKKGLIQCALPKNHDSLHGTYFDDTHGKKVLVLWNKEGPFGSCHSTDPETGLYCGLEMNEPHLFHLAPCDGGGTLAVWPNDSAPGTYSSRTNVRYLEAGEVRTAIKESSVFVPGCGDIVSTNKILEKLKL